MPDSRKTLCNMACLESLHNHHGYLVETIGRLFRLLKSMPEGADRNRLLDEISSLDVIAGGIKTTLEERERHIN